MGSQGRDQRLHSMGNSLGCFFLCFFLFARAVFANPNVDISVDVASDDEGNTSTITYTVTMDATSPDTETVDYVITGTADLTDDYIDGGGDYTIASDGQMSFTTGQTTKTIVMTVQDDNIDEDNETVIITITSASGLVVGTGDITHTINDDDDPPVLTLAGTDLTSTEASTTTGTITANLSRESSAELTINLTLGGTASTGSGTDYNLSGTGVTWGGGTSMTVTFPAGTTSRTITITPNDDDIDEADPETVSFTTANGTGYTHGTTSQTVNVSDNDDAPVLTIAATDLTSTEASTTTGQVTLNLSRESSSNLTINVDLTGTGSTVDGTDYSLSGTGVTWGGGSSISVDFPAGTTSRTITLTPNDDSIDEADETAIFTTANGTGYTHGTTDQTITVSDDDTANLTLTDTDLTSTEASTTTATVTVNLSVASSTAKTINLTVGGTASTVDGTDYSMSGTDVTWGGGTSMTVDFPAGTTSRTITITPNDDSIDEADETISFTTANGTGYTHGTTSETVTITDDDTAVLTLTGTDLTSTEASTTTGTITVNLDIASSTAKTINLTLGGTASTGSGTDYNLSGTDVTWGGGTSMTVDFPAGTTSRTITLTPVDDDIDEDDPETITFTTANGTGYTHSSDLETMNLSDNDDPPVLTLAGTDLTSTEASTTTGTITANLSRESSAELTINLTLGGTASTGSGTDYNLSGTGVTWGGGTSMTVTFPAGTTSRTITLTPVDDDIDEADDETVSFTTANGTGYTHGTTDQTVNVSDNDDAPVLTIAATDLTSTEASATTGQVTLNLSRESSSNLTINVDLTGTGSTVDGTDYSLSGTGVTWGGGSSISVDFPAGTTSRTITLTPNDDSIDEADETAIFTTANGTGYTHGTTDQTITITDDDTAVLSLTGTDLTSTEASTTTGAITVNLDIASSTAKTINLTLGGTASTGSGTDYNLSGTDVTWGGGTSMTVDFPAGTTSRTITLTPVDDDIDEDDPETITFTTANGTGYTHSSDVETMNLSDNDDAPVLTLAGTDLTSTEASTTTGTITANLSRESSAELTINLTLGGTASTGSGTDYNLSGTGVTWGGGTSMTVTFPAGTTSRTITLTPVDDDIDEDDPETVSFTTANGTGYTHGTTDQTVNISDNDDPPVLTIAGTDLTSTEASTTTGQVTLNLSRESSSNLTINVDLTGTGSTVDGTDYSLSGTGVTWGGGASISVDFPAGTTSRTITLTPNDDSIDEADETAIFTTANGTGYTHGTTDQTITITDDDAAVLTLTGTDLTSTEASTTTGTVTVNLSVASSTAKTINLTIGGAASTVDGTDYSMSGTDVTWGGGTSMTVDFPAGTTSRTITITPNDDSIDEADETISFTTANGTGYTHGTTSETVTITDDDTAVLTLTGTDLTSTEASTTTGTITVNLDIASSTAKTINLTLGGTASTGSGTDYNLSGTDVTWGGGTSMTVDFPAGTTSRTITLTPVDDDVDEDDPETITFTTANGTGYTHSSDLETMNLSDNDDPPVLTLAGTDLTSTEASTTTGTVTANLSRESSAELTINLTLGGTASTVSGTDYSLSGTGVSWGGGTSMSVTFPAGTTSRTITITPNDDDIDEADDETVSFTTADGTGYTHGTTDQTVNVSDNDDAPVLTIAGTDLTSTEASTTTGQVTLNLSRESSSNLTINVDLTGTGSTADGTDYSLSGTGITWGGGASITADFPAGTTSRTITLTPNDESLDEEAETAIFTTANGTGYTHGTTDQTITITDDDTAVLTFTGTDLSADEEGPDTGTLTATLDLTASYTKTINIDITGTASTVDGTDYSLSGTGLTWGGGPSLTLSFPAGTQTRTITLTPNDDSDPEDDPETAIFTTANGTGYTHSSTALTVNIAENEHKPTISSVSTLTGATEDTDFTITYSDLTTAADENDLDGDAISFRVEAVSTGTLEKNSSAVIPGTTTVGSGEEFVWLGDLDDNGSGILAFTVKVYDGTFVSDNTVQVSVDVSAVNDAPVNTAIPTISGTLGLTETLSAADGTWNDNKDTDVSGSSTLSYTYQWERADDNSGTNAGDISGATSDTYVQTSDDLNKYIRVKVTATDDGVGSGGDQATEAQSAWSNQIVNRAPTASDNTVTGKEDSDFTFVVADFGYSDLDAHAFTQIQVSNITGSGTLFVDDNEDGVVDGGESVSNSDVIVVADLTKLKLKPVADENGNSYATFDFNVHDGLAYSSSAYTMTIDIFAVNDMPTFTKGADQSGVLEDAGAQAVNGWATSISKGPGNESAQSLGFDVSVTNTTRNLAFDTDPAIDASGNLTYTATANTNGVATVRVRLGDNGGTDSSGVDSSNVETFTITITDVNDEPSFTKGANVTSNEDIVFSEAGWATSIEDNDAEETQVVSFTVTNDNNALFDVQPAVSATGELTYTPAAEANGSATATIYISDDAGTDDGGDDESPTQNFTITVRSVNDPPVMTDIVDPSAILEGDLTQQTVNFTGIGDGDDDLVQNITHVEARSLRQGFIADGDISVTYSANDPGGSVSYNINHADSNETGVIEVIVHDDGGTDYDGQDTLVKTFTVTVTPVNDAPVIDAISDPSSILEDAAIQTVNFTGVSDSDPQNQTITITATSDNTGLIPNPTVNYTSGNATGNLQYTPVANQSGTATIRVLVKDDGGLTNGGVDSTFVTFDVVVTGTNDAPTASAATINATEDQIYTFASNNFNFSDLDGDTLTKVWVTGLSSANGTFFVDSNSNDVVDSGEEMSANDTLYVATIANMKFSPDEDEYGNNFATLNYKVHDGSVYSTATTTMTIHIAAVNDAPTFDVITTPDTTQEDAGSATTFTIYGINTGPDNESGQGTSVSATAVSNTIVSIQSVTHVSGEDSAVIAFIPLADQNGNATISVTVTDDGGGSNDDFTRFVTAYIEPVNDPPTHNALISPPAILEDASEQTFDITGLDDGDVNEAQTFTFEIRSSDSSIIDEVDVEHFDGNNWARLSYTPNANANGTVTITIVARDNGGTAYSAVDSVVSNFTVTVTAVNDRPNFTEPSDFSILEESGPGTLTITGVGDGDADVVQNLSMAVTSNNNTAILTVDSLVYTPNETSATLYYTPIANRSGVANVDIRVTDDGGTANSGLNSRTRDVNITINAVNDAPTINSIADLADIDEDASQQNVYFSGVDDGDTDETQALQVEVDISDSSIVNFVNVAYTSPNNSGNLYFTPLEDANGSVTFTVRVIDDGGIDNSGIDTVLETFSVNILPVNDSPSFTKGSNILIQESDTFQIVTGWATDIDDGDPDLDQTVSFSISGDFSLFDVPPYIDSITGDLSFQPKTQTFGSATLNVELIDDGSNAGDNSNTSVAQSVTFNIIEINDPPTFDAGSDITINEGAGFQNVINWATNLNDSDPNAVQTLSFDVQNSDSSKFVQQPVLSVTGTTANLSFQAQPKANGVITVISTLMDDGESTAPSDNTSEPDTMTITINAVNNEPTINGIADPADIFEDSGEQAINLTGIDDGDDEVVQTLTITAESSDNSIVSTFTVDYNQGDNTATLRYTPVLNASGSATITVTVKDDAGTALGGDDEVSTDFDITINPINDPPTITTIPDPYPILEDATQQTVVMAGISDGDAEATETVAITATSSNTDIISTVLVDYNSGDNTGTIRYTPEPNASGLDTIFVRLVDNGGTANGGQDTNIVSFVVEVTPVNDRPNLNAISDPAAILEDDPAVQTIKVTGIDDGDADQNQGIEVTATSSNLDLILTLDVDYNQGDDTATISYQPRSDANGVTTITVTVQDSAGTENSGVDEYSREFDVNVTAVNDEPTMAGINPIYLNEGDPNQFINIFGVSDGDPEIKQNISLSIIAFDTNFYLSQPNLFFNSGSNGGLFQFLPGDDATGTDTVLIKLEDDGGLANGGVDTSIHQIIINLAPVNDPPTVDAIADVDSLLEDSGEQTITLAGLSDGDLDQEQSMSFYFTSSNEDLLNTISVDYTDGDSTAILRYTPNADKFGSVTVRMLIRDDAGVEDGGVDTVFTTFTVNVIPINDAPTAYDTTIVTNRNETLNFMESDIPFVDTDGTFNGFRIFGMKAGEVFYESTEVTDTLVIDSANVDKLSFVPVADSIGKPYSFFQFQVRDDVGLFSDSTYTLKVSVNSRPTSENGLISLDANVDYNFSNGDIPFSDADGIFGGIVLADVPENQMFLINDTLNANDTILASSIKDMLFKPINDSIGLPYGYFSFYVLDNDLASSVEVDSILINVNTKVPSAVEFTNLLDSQFISMDSVLKWTETEFSLGDIIRYSIQAFEDTTDGDNILEADMTQIEHSFREILRRNEVYFPDKDSSSYDNRYVFLRVSVINDRGARSEYSAWHSVWINTEKYSPPPVTILTPEDSTIIFTQEPTFSWTSLVDTTARWRDTSWHVLQVDTADGFENPLHSINMEQDTIIQFTEDLTLNDDEGYFYRVKTITNDDTIYSNTSYMFINRENDPPTTPVPFRLGKSLLFTNGDERSSQDTIGWTRQDSDPLDKLTYLVEVSEDSVFSSPVIEYETENELLTLAELDTAGVLEEAGKYFIRARSFDLRHDTSAYSPDTNYFYYNNVNDKPLEPFALFPLNGTRMSEVNAFFFKCADPDSLGNTPDTWTFGIQLSLDSNFNEITFDLDKINTGSIAITSMANMVLGNRYYWRVWATDNHGLSSDTTSAVRFINFEKTNRPKSLRSGLTGEVRDFELLSWESSNYGDYFSIQISSDKDFTDTLLQYDNLDTITFISPDRFAGFDTLQKNLTYFWRVNGTDPAFGTTSSYSAALSFLFKGADSVATAPNVLFPDSMGYISPVQNIHFEKSLDSDDEGLFYNLEIATTNSFDSVITSMTNILNNQDTLTFRLDSLNGFQNMTALDTYYLRIWPTTVIPSQLDTTFYHDGDTSSVIPFIYGVDSAQLEIVNILPVVSSALKLEDTIFWDKTLYPYSNYQIKVRDAKDSVIVDQYMDVHSADSIYYTNETQVYITIDELFRRSPYNFEEFYFLDVQAIATTADETPGSVNNGHYFVIADTTKKQEKVKTSAWIVDTNEVTIHSGDSVLTIDIPRGAFDKPTGLIIQRMEKDTAIVQDSSAKELTGIIGDAVRKLSANSNVKFVGQHIFSIDAVDFQTKEIVQPDSNSSISINFNAINVETIEDIPKIVFEDPDADADVQTEFNVEHAAIFLLDEESRRWQRQNSRSMDQQEVLALSKRVTGKSALFKKYENENSDHVYTMKTNHFSVYTMLMTSGDTNAFTSFKVYPSPVRLSSEDEILRKAAIEFNINSTTEVNVRIFSQTGGLVWSSDTTLNNEDRIPVSHRVMWDGTNMNGYAVGNGYYVVKVKGKDANGKTYYRKKIISVIK